MAAGVRVVLLDRDFAVLVAAELPLAVLFAAALLLVEVDLAEVVLAEFPGSLLALWVLLLVWVLLLARVLLAAPDLAAVWALAAVLVLPLARVLLCVPDLPTVWALAACEASFSALPWVAVFLAEVVWRDCDSPLDLSAVLAPDFLVLLTDLVLREVFVLDVAALELRAVGDAVFSCMSSVVICFDAVVFFEAVTFLAAVVLADLVLTELLVGVALVEEALASKDARAEIVRADTVLFVTGNLSEVNQITYQGTIIIYTIKFSVSMVNLNHARGNPIFTRCA